MSLRLHYFNKNNSFIYKKETAAARHETIKIKQQLIFNAGKQRKSRAGRICDTQLLNKKHLLRNAIQ